MIRTSCRLGLVLAVVFVVQSFAVAANPTPTYTTITVNDMHCATCAKKIAAKLYVVAGVLEVRADVKKDTAYVVPQKQKSPSPRAMWEAVESAGFKPLKMHGPAGYFVKKPNR